METPWFCNSRHVSAARILFCIRSWTQPKHHTLRVVVAFSLPLFNNNGSLLRFGPLVYLIEMQSHSTPFLSGVYSFWGISLVLSMCFLGFISSTFVSFLVAISCRYILQANFDVHWGGQSVAALFSVQDCDALCVISEGLRRTLHLIEFHSLASIVQSFRLISMLIWVKVFQLPSINCVLKVQSHIKSPYSSTCKVTVKRKLRLPSHKLRLPSFTLPNLWKLLYSLALSNLTDNKQQLVYRLSSVQTTIVAAQ